MRFLRRHRDGQTFPLQKGEVKSFYDEVWAKRRLVAKQVATNAGREAGNIHAVKHGRLSGVENWNPSDKKAADEKFWIVYYDLVPQDSPWAGRIRGRVVSHDSGVTEVIRGLKKLHVIHGYVPPEESREEFVARLGLRHVPGAKKEKQ